VFVKKQAADEVAANSAANAVVNEKDVDKQALLTIIMVRKCAMAAAGTNLATLKTVDSMTKPQGGQENDTKRPGWMRRSQPHR
jgi:hypothetical protein